MNIKITLLLILFYALQQISLAQKLKRIKLYDIHNKYSKEIMTNPEN
jgi:hypothetical protein